MWVYDFNEFWNWMALKSICEEILMTDHGVNNQPIGAPNFFFKGVKRSVMNQKSDYFNDI